MLSYNLAITMTPLASSIVISYFIDNIHIAEIFYWICQIIHKYPSYFSLIMNQTIVGNRKGKTWKLWSGKVWQR